MPVLRHGSANLSNCLKKIIRIELKDSMVTIKIYAKSEIPLLIVKRQIYETTYANHFSCMIGYHYQVYGKNKIKVVKSRVSEYMDL
jgi:hypothetical protein